MSNRGAPLFFLHLVSAPRTLGAEMPAMNPRRVLIVEDDVFVAGLLEQSLRSNGFETAIAHSAVKARAELETFEPDVALIDVELGDGPNGTELMSVIVRTHPETAVLMMTQRAAIAPGIELPEGVAFLLKSKITDAPALVEAIENTIRGLGHLARHSAEAGELAGLTRVQEEVLRMIALGYSNTRIAQERGVTRSGAEQAVSSVLRALNITDTEYSVPRVEAARRYIAARGVPKQP